MSHLSASLEALVLSGIQDGRFALLDSFPPGLSIAFFQHLEAKGLNPQWILEDAIEGGDLKLTWNTDEERVVVVDALHQAHGPTLERHIKMLLHSFPKMHFYFLGSGNLRGAHIPDYYGTGRYVRCDEKLPITGDVDSPTQMVNDSTLLQHSRRILPKYSLNDLVLGNMTQLKFDEAIAYVQTKSFCENEWGFRKRHSRGHGVTLLFHGDSGTGKTMAAEVIAHELKMPLYQVDLSAIVSKWVGETEKNLKAIFRAAEGLHGILLFDEGDAIFGQRTKQESSQDRYSNLEVNYLLQEIETFNGIAILSTNYFTNMDPAFLRRFSYVIHFGLPEQDQRRKIWDTNIPKELPLGKSVDLDNLSQFGLTGGNIRNAVRYAAAQAAMNQRKAVEQEDFLWAIKRELQKHDQTLPRELVGEEYWKLIAPEWEASQTKAKLQRRRESLLERVPTSPRP